MNEDWRRGLKQMMAPIEAVEPCRTRTVSLGRCLTGDFDDVAEALALAEGDGFR